MTVSVEDLKNQLRIDGNDEDDTLKVYLSAAESFIKNAVNSSVSWEEFNKDDEISKLVNLAVISFAMNAYINRSAKIATNTVVDSLVGQLRGLYALWEGRNA